MLTRSGVTTNALVSGGQTLGPGTFTAPQAPVPTLLRPRVPLKSAVRMPTSPKALPAPPPGPSLPVFQIPLTPPQVQPQVPPQVQPQVPPQVQPQVPPQVQPQVPPQVQPQVPPQVQPAVFDEVKVPAEKPTRWWLLLLLLAGVLGGYALYNKRSA